MSQDIKCAECDEWAPENEWQDCEIPCDSCGDHLAIRCPKCGAAFDEIFRPLKGQLERRGL